MNSNEQKGFTLVELLLVVGLVALIAGFSGDIILSLVRSYNKTSTINEIEQVGNLAMGKLEKELKSASIVRNGIGCSTTLDFSRKDPLVSNQTLDVVYTVTDNGSLTRSETVSGNPVGSSVPVIDSSQLNVELPASDSNAFCVIQEHPHVITINFDLSESTLTGGSTFTGNILLTQTVVLRGTY